MDEVNNTLPASEHETFALEDDGREGKYQSPDNARDDESSASSSTHSTSGVVSASSPGSQRDFYSHVSGAGDGFSLQTSEGDTQKTLNGIKMEGEEPVVVRSSAAEFEENNRNGVNLRDISKDWSNKIQRLNRTIQAVLKNVPDPNKVDVSIGKTPILRDKEVVLALHKAPKRLDQSMDSGLFSPPGISDIKFTETQDGIVLYCVIRVREDFQDSTDNETSAIKDIFRQACSSPDQIVPKINLDAFDLGDKIKRRSPKSRKSPRRSPTKGSPRKSGVDGEERDSEGRQLQGGKDYEDEDMYSTSSDFDDEEYTTEAENEEYKHRRGVGIKDDDDYRIMRSRPAEPGSPTKKSVTWRKEIDRRDGSADKKDTSPKRGSKETTGSGSRTGSRESSASSPRRKGTSDTDSPKSGSRRSSMSPRRRGSSESKGTDEDSPKSGSRRSSSEQSPRRNDTNGSKRGSDESVRFDQNGYVEDMSNGRQQIDIDEQDYGGKAEIGARSRALRKDENGSDRRKYRNEYDHGKQIIDSSYDEYSLEDERKLFLKLDDSMSSHEKERLIRRRRTALRRRRRRAEQLKSGEPFDVQLSETEGSNGERRPRTAKEKHHINKLRREYLNPDIDAIDGDDYKEYDPDYDRNGDERHDTCFLPFEGYDENYDGPVGVLTSKLPDGSSTAGTLFTTFDIQRRKSSLPFLDFYDLHMMMTTGIYLTKSIKTRLLMESHVG